MSKPPNAHLFILNACHSFNMCTRDAMKSKWNKFCWCTFFRDSIFVKSKHYILLFLLDAFLMARQVGNVLLHNVVKYHCTCTVIILCNPITLCQVISAYSTCFSPKKNCANCISRHCNFLKVCVAQALVGWHYGEERVSEI